MQQFSADCDDLDEWLEEKMIAAQDETYRWVQVVVVEWEVSDETYRWVQVLVVEW